MKFESPYFDVDDFNNNIFDTLGELRLSEQIADVINNEVGDIKTKKIAVDAEHLHVILDEFYNKLTETVNILNNVANPTVNHIPADQMFIDLHKTVNDITSL